MYIVSSPIITPNSTTPITRRGVFSALLHEYKGNFSIKLRNWRESHDLLTRLGLIAVSKMTMVNLISAPPSLRSLLTFYGCEREAVANPETCVYKKTM